MGVPCLGALTCFGVPCCAVVCSAVLCCTVPRRAVLCPALPCRAVLCRAVLCLAVLWRAAFCCAVPRRAVPCFAVSLRLVPCCGVLCCAVRDCAVLCCIVLCCAVLCCAVLCGWSVAPHGPAWGGQGNGQTGCLAVWVAGAPCGLGLCGRLVAGGRGLTWCGLRGQCYRGLGVPSGPMRREGVRGVALPFGPMPWSGGVPCPLAVPVPRGAPGSAGWGGVGSSAWLVLLPWAVTCLPASVTSPVLGVVALSPFLPRRPCPCVGVVAPAVERGRGCCLAIRVRWWLVRCSR